MERHTFHERTRYHRYHQPERWRRQVHEHNQHRRRARQPQHDVLAADLDPQGYLTNKLGLDEAYKDDPPSMFEAMKEPTEHDITNLTVEHDEFDVLPGNIDMFRLEQDLIASGWRPRERL